MSRWATAWSEAAVRIIEMSAGAAVSTRKAASCPAALPGADCSVSSVTLPEGVELEQQLALLDTPELKTLDQQDGAKTAERTCEALQRPPSWSQSAMRPSPGYWCGCCLGHRWWTERDAMNGWCCLTCHPPPKFVEVLVRSTTETDGILKRSDSQNRALDESHNENMRVD